MYYCLLLRRFTLYLNDSDVQYPSAKELLLDKKIPFWYYLCGKYVYKSITVFVLVPIKIRRKAYSLTNTFTSQTLKTDRKIEKKLFTSL